MAFPDQDLVDSFSSKPQSQEPHRVEKYLKIRETALDFARLINDLCPDSREKSLVITKLEEAVMWANKSIANFKA